MTTPITPLYPRDDHMRRHGSQGFPFRPLMTYHCIENNDNASCNCNRCFHFKYSFFSIKISACFILYRFISVQSEILLADHWPSGKWALTSPMMMINRSTHSLVYFLHLKRNCFAFMYDIKCWMASHYISTLYCPSPSGPAECKHWGTKVQTIITKPEIYYEMCKL